jgi:hypothetical protein
MTKVPKSKLKIDVERDLVKQEGEINEYLDATGQEDDAKAAKWVIETEKQKEKELQKEQIKKVEELERTRKWTKKEYIFKLAEMANEMAKSLDLPKGYIYRINFNDEKLNVILKTPTGKFFGRGIKPCGITTYDYQAIETILLQCENTVDKLEARGQYRKDGIIVPEGVK